MIMVFSACPRCGWQPHRTDGAVRTDPDGERYLIAVCTVCQAASHLGAGREQDKASDRTKSPQTP